MKTSTTLFYALLGTLLISSCNSNTPCPDTQDLGVLSYKQKSLSTIPYIDKSKVIFKDSLGAEIAYDIYDLGDTIRPHAFAGGCETDPAQNVLYTYDALTRAVYLRNDSLKSSFYIGLDINLAFVSYKDYDKLSVSISNDNVTSYQNFQLLVDRRNVSEQQAMEINEHYALDTEVEFFGKTFKDAYHYIHPDNYQSHLLYYNFEFGIISFVDISGKEWVFDRME